MITLRVSEKLADSIRDWALDERDYWPELTIYQADLADLLAQLDAHLPSADDVRGIMSE